MGLLTILIVLVVVGLVLWAINSYIPMADNIKKLLNVVVAVFLVIWLLQAAGAWSYLQNIKI